MGCRGDAEEGRGRGKGGRGLWFVCEAVACVDVTDKWADRLRVS